MNESFQKKKKSQRKHVMKQTHGCTSPFVVEHCVWEATNMASGKIHDHTWYNSDRPIYFLTT